MIRGPRAVLTVSSWLALLLAVEGQKRSSQKAVIHTAGDLPQFSFQVRESPSKLLSPGSAYSQLAVAFESHIQKVLSRYEVRDQATLSMLHQRIAQLEALEQHYDRAKHEAAIAAALMAKVPERQRYTLTFAADLKALQVLQAEHTSQEHEYRAFLQQLFERVSWKDAGEAALALKGFCTRLSPVYAQAVVDGDAGPAETGGTIHDEVAAEIVNFRFVLNRLPLCRVTSEVLDGWLKLHRKEEANVFGDRELSLLPSDRGHPVVLAVWDTGIDRAVFPDRLALPARATMPGTDWNGRTTEGDLQFLSPNETERMAETLRLVRGLGDSFEGLDSADAAFYGDIIRRLRTEEEARDLDHRVWVVANYYTHGTAVAGLALQGNPFARLLSLRLEPPDRATAPVPTVEGARRAVDRFTNLIAYCKTNHARVVNMSWGIGLGDLENQLEKQPNLSSDARHKLAQSIFAFYQEGLRKAINEAPEILFVAAAGNSGADPEFDLAVPQNLWQLPNVIVVGALDRAALPSWISNYGPSVKLYALGERVRCLLPGGTATFMTGTSMAAPAVTNLAGKLLALRPDLEPRQVAELMIRGAVPSREGGFPGLNPNGSRNLLSRVGQIH